jgi:hypothetical protein
MLMPAMSGRHIVVAFHRGGAMTTFEIHLRECDPAQSLIVVTARDSDSEALAYAEALLERYPEYYLAEVWQGMKRIGQVA